MHDITDEIIQQAAAAGIHQLCPRANIISDSEVAKALQAGFSVRGWGIKDTEVGPGTGDPSHRAVMSCACGPSHRYDPPAADSYAAGTQLLLRMKASGAQGCTVNWPDRAATALLEYDNA